MPDLARTLRLTRGVMWARFAGAVAAAICGRRVTLTLGAEATPGQIDDVQPNEEFEEGLVGEPRPPQDTPYSLSRGAVRGEGDVPPGATSAEPTLVPGGESNPAATVSAVIPAVAPGAYDLIACANDSHPVPETSAANNCFSPPQTFTIGVTAG